MECLGEGAAPFSHNLRARPRLILEVVTLLVKTFAAYVKEQARRLGKTQKMLAQELKVSPAYISQLLTGKKQPPDFGRPRNKAQLSVWCTSLQVPESDLLEIVRHDLHNIPLLPTPRFPRMRALLIQRLKKNQKRLVNEIKFLELHPAETRVIDLATKIYLFIHEEMRASRAYGPTRFRALVAQAKASKSFVENALVDYLADKTFVWTWRAAANEARLDFQSPELEEALCAVERLLSNPRSDGDPLSIPLVGHVSAGEGFEYTDGGFTVGEGFEQVPMPPGVDTAIAKDLYCVRVRGDSLSEFFGDGTLLFVKPESWEEIREGDLVIFKDRSTGKAFVKKVHFSGDDLFLRSMSPYYRSITMKRTDLMLLERVVAVVF
uniref:Helix-turn-helix domain-containing protein n=1 Tax=Desulfomonile tiedjei TaxID=2358 RepID=A0A7C4ERB0_9BACT